LKKKQRNKVFSPKRSLIISFKWKSVQGRLSRSRQRMKSGEGKAMALEVLSKPLFEKLFLL